MVTVVSVIKPLGAAVSVVLVLAACTSAPGTDDTQAADSPNQPSTTVSQLPGGGGTPTTSEEPSQPTTTSDRPLAPDFTLELGDGGSYTLSEGSKPVYLVFWAEW